MSDIVFPSELPKPLFEGFSKTFEKTSTRTPFEVGVPRKRREFSKPPPVVSVVWNFTAAQFLVFDTWFIENIDCGTQSFDILLAGLWWEANFTENPPYSAESTFDESRWLVSSRLMLNVGPGLSSRPNLTQLAAALHGSVRLRSLLTRNARAGAQLAGSMRLHVVPQPQVTVQASIFGSIDLNVTLSREVTLVASLVGSVESSASLS